MAFQKGQSGNPGGKSKEQVAFMKLARSKAPAAFKRILKMATEPNPDQNIVLKANQFIVERAWGKAAQSIEANVSGDVTHYVARLPAIIEDAKKWLEQNKK